MFFPGNIVLQSRFDPVAVRVQSLMPSATLAGAINNFDRRYIFHKIQDIPNLKVDHNFRGNSKVSVYWSMRSGQTRTTARTRDCLILSRHAGDQVNRSQTTRVNYDQSLT